MIIRTASSTDAAAIAEIWNREIRQGVSTFNSVEKTHEDVAAMISASGAAFQVAEANDTVLGFATYYPFRGGVGYAFTKEHSIYLNEAAQGQGAGRALMVALLEVARSEGVHSMMAAISGENESGQRFHAALGFKPVAQVPQVGYKFNRWMDLILMQKFL